MQNTYGGAQHGYTYTYDNNGNILTVSDGTNTTSYSYDALGQLIRENNQPAGKTWVWTYDSGGNILSRTEYAYTTGSPGTALSSASYTYGDTGWGDLLTAYNGQAITYDGIGNMTSYGGWSLGWSGGRRLSTMSRDGTSLLFAYNDEGQRTEKTVNGSTHKYLYRGGLLIADICGNDALYFRYDQNGEVIGFLRTLGVNRAEYRYVKNQQGDVVAVIDFAGAEAATYSYDGWGNLLTTGGYDANLASRNPLRYRGYYYDSETALYYVSSRYYDPDIGRWINADTTDVLSLPYYHLGQYNLFSYCNNNPVNDRDDDGQLSWLAKIAIGAAAIAIGVGVTALTGGAALPALVAGVKAACVAGAISAGTSATTTAVRSAVSGDSFSTVVQKSAKAAVDGFTDGFMAGGIAAGASQVASGGFKIAAKIGAKTGKSSGIKIGNTKILSPDAAWHKNNGGTLLKIGKNFRIDVGSNTLLHMHLPNVSSHIQIGTIGAGIYGGLK